MKDQSFPTAIFMGTPDFAANILQKIVDSQQVNVLAVYTQPDRPAGRGKALQAPAVKELALANSLPVYQPKNFNDSADRETLAAFTPDFLFVAAYGLILPQSILDIPTILPINVHASLLPKYRGAAPIQRAIINGERFTGITIMHMQAGLDTGPILLQRALGIDINDTAATLHDELSDAGAELLLEAIQRLREGRIRAVVQDDSASSYAAMLSKKDGVINFSHNKQQIHAHIRGVTPWPAAQATLQREGESPIAITLEPGMYPYTGELPEEGLSQGNIPGAIAGVYGDALLVRCGDGWYAFTHLRPAGKKTMDGKAFYNGYLTRFPDAKFV